MLREEERTRLILWMSSGATNVELKVPITESLSASDALKRAGWALSRRKLREMKKGDLVSISSFEGAAVTLMTSSLSYSPSSQLLPRWEAELIKLETKMAARFQNYKFGILYVKAGQKTEEEMFSNRISSRAFRAFCKILGDKIELKDWPFFTGGLDVKSDRTGKHSLYTQHCGYDIMFHVSTMLPWNEGDQQQIDRKRHIGNDVVIVAFVDEDASDLWCPTIISSRFPHLYAVVKPITTQNGDTSYLFNLAVKENVSTFGPPLPSPPIFHDPTTFRHFLLSKLINGEREAIRTVPDFHQDSAHLSDLQDLFEKVSKASQDKDKANTASPASDKLPKEATMNREKDPSIDLTTGGMPTMSLLGQSSPNLFGPKGTPIAPPLGSKDSSPLNNMGGSFNVPSNVSSRDLRARMEASGPLNTSTTPPTGSPGSNVPHNKSTRDLRARMDAAGVERTSSGSPALPTSTSTRNLNYSIVSTPSPSSTGDSPMGSMVSSSSAGDLSMPKKLAPLSLYSATEQIQAFQTKPALLSFPAEITCADAWENRFLIGTVDGLFVADFAQFAGASVKNTLTEVKCLVHKGQPYRHNYYQQITVIEELGILLALIPKVGVVMYDLTSLLTPSGPHEMLLRKTKGATLYSLGAYQGILQLGVSTPRGIVIHRWTNDMFNLSQIIQIGAPTVMEFDAKGYIIAAASGEYSFIKPDPENPTMNLLREKDDKRSLEPVSVLLFEDSAEYLLCYDLVGFFVNSAGQKSRNYEFVWLAPPEHVVSIFPYLLVFTKHHIEVRFVANGALVQLLDLDVKNDASLKFMTTSAGIWFATVSAKNEGSAHSSAGGHSSQQQSTGGKDLTSSSGSSSTPTPSSSTTLTTASSSSSITMPNSVGGSSPSGSQNKDGTNSASPTSSSAFNVTLSTVHWLRLNSAQTALVTNPQALTNPNTSFLALGLNSTGSGSLPPSAPSSFNHTLSHRSLRYSFRSTGGGSNSSVMGGGDMSAGSSPQSPASSFLQAHLMNEGTASFDDSEELFRLQAQGSNYSNREEDNLSGGGSSPQIAPFRRKSPDSRRENAQRTAINSLHSSNGSNHSSGTNPNPSGPPLTPGQLAMLRYKSTEEMHTSGNTGGSGGSPMRSSIKTFSADDSAFGRSSSAAKANRRKSLAVDAELLYQQQQRRQRASLKLKRKSSDFSDNFDFEVEDVSPKGRPSRDPHSESSESPRRPTSKAETRRRHPSDKLSGSGERSPRTSPLPPPIHTSVTYVTPKEPKQEAAPERKLKKKEKSSVPTSSQPPSAASTTSISSNDSEIHAPSPHKQHSFTTGAGSKPSDGAGAAPGSQPLPLSKSGKRKSASSLTPSSSLGDVSIPSESKPPSKPRHATSARSLPRPLVLDSAHASSSSDKRKSELPSTSPRSKRQKSPDRTPKAAEAEGSTSPRSSKKDKRTSEQRRSPPSNTPISAAPAALAQAPASPQSPSQSRKSASGQPMVRRAKSSVIGPVSIESAPDSSHKKDKKDKSSKDKDKAK